MTCALIGSGTMYSISTKPVAKYMSSPMYSFVNCGIQHLKVTVYIASLYLGYSERRQSHDYSIQWWVGVTSAIIGLSTITGWVGGEGTP